MRIALLVLVALASCSRGRRTTPAETSAIRWELPVEVATGGGTRGAWRQNDSDYDHVDDGTVALAADGTVLVAWVDHRSKEIFVQRYSRDGVAQSSPVAVSRSPTVFSWLPRLAITGDDVYVLWQEIVFSGGSHGGEAFFARSRDAGVTFEPPLNLSQSRNGDGKGRISRDVWNNGSFDLAVDRDGTLYATWTEFDGPLWLTRSTDAGATFTAPVQISDGTLPARAPTLATGAGAVFLAYSVGDDTSGDLRLAVSRDGGDTFAPSIITQTRGFSDAAKIAVDDTGTLHVTWAESIGGPGTRSAIRYMRSRDGGRTFEAARELTSATQNNAAYPMLAVDGSNVLVSWELVTDMHQRSRGLALSYSLDGGSTFTKPAFIAHSIDRLGGFNGSHQGRLMEKLALRDGEIVVANSALAHGRGSRVWLVRGQLPTSRSPLASASNRSGDR
jgi:hypothetical protein